MKKVTFSLLAILVSMSAYCQFGVSLGYYNSKYQLKIGKDGASTDPYHGGFIDLNYKIEMKNALSIQPELLFSLVEEGTAVISIPVPVLYTIQDVVDLQIGPYFSYSLEESLPEYTNFSIGGLIGASININKAYLQFRYLPQFTNSYTGGDFFGESMKFRTNSIVAGVGFRF